MTGFLLDTNVILLAGFRSAALSQSVKSAIERGPNYLSVISYWEVALKNMKGRLDVGDPRIWWSEALKQMAATPLLLRAEHIAELWLLPPLHSDPFDRILIAQARVEMLTLLTTDSTVSAYASRHFQVIH